MGFGLLEWKAGQVGSRGDSRWNVHRVPANGRKDCKERFSIDICAA